VNVSEEEDREEARQKEFSLLRPELDYLDLISQSEEQCDGKLRLSYDTVTVTHECTRPAGHSGQHYSFSSGSDQYEVIWPTIPPKEESRCGC
jgi:hypothetical protein